MNDSIFLITNRGTFTIKQTRIGLVILGILMILLNVAAFLETSSLVQINPFMILLGFSFLLTGTIGLSKNSKFSPKVFLTNDFISIKEGLWSGSHKYHWNDIEEINLGSFKITVNTKNKSKTFNIDSTSQISIDIKKAIKEIGKQKSIPVTGG